jgi:hypothetical protein
MSTAMATARPVKAIKGLCSTRIAPKLGLWGRLGGSLSISSVRPWRCCQDRESSGMMAAQCESHVTVWRKAGLRCISFTISRFDSEHRLGAPCSEPGPGRPGPACIRSATACIRQYDPGPAAAAGGHGSSDQLPVRSLKMAMKLSRNPANVATGVCTRLAQGIPVSRFGRNRTGIGKTPGSRFGRERETGPRLAANREIGDTPREYFAAGTILGWMLPAGALSVPKCIFWPPPFFLKCSRQVLADGG